MLDAIVNFIKLFREQIYCFFPRRRDAAMELINALASNTTAGSVVALSLNPLHRRNYCSITRVLDEFFLPGMDRKTRQDDVTKILSEQCIELIEKDYYLSGVDCTPNPRRYAPTQKDCGFVYAPNMISGNKPVTIGVHLRHSLFVF
jgi:hypothetical protein